MADETNNDAPITRDDIEERFRSIAGEVEERKVQIRNGAVAGAAVVLAILILMAFLSGQRRGRRRTTIVEVRRV